MPLPDDEHQSWLGLIEADPFPVEWSARGDIRSADEISTEMTKLGTTVAFEVTRRFLIGDDIEARPMVLDPAYLSEALEPGTVPVGLGSGSGDAPA